jgi:hypothetical protein
MDELTVTVPEVSALFDGLVAGAISREGAERWAEERMRAEDAGRLRYEPAEEEARLWDAILYLSGVGLRTSPTEYLHPPEEFASHRTAAGL